MIHSLSHLICLSIQIIFQIWFFEDFLALVETSKELSFSKDTFLWLCLNSVQTYSCSLFFLGVSCLLWIKYYFWWIWNRKLLFRKSSLLKTQNWLVKSYSKIRIFDRALARAPKSIFICWKYLFVYLLMLKNKYLNIYLLICWNQNQQKNFDFENSYFCWNFCWICW